ncbi:Uncharacterised protein [Vibrio cholerae]|nr:Uncharacterised protein [Vibrio cholerae]
MTLVIHRAITKAIIVNKTGSRTCSRMDKFFSENGMLNLFKRNARIHANGSIPSTKNRQNIRS